MPMLWFGRVAEAALGSDIALSLYRILSFSKRMAVESDILLCWFRCFPVALNGAFSAWGDLVLGVGAERFVAAFMWMMPPRPVRLYVLGR